MGISGFYALIPNPHRKCWQFWKPRLVLVTDPAKFIAGCRRK